MQFETKTQRIIMKKTVLTLAISAIVFGATTQVNAAGYQLAEYSATGKPLLVAATIAAPRA